MVLVNTLTVEAINTALIALQRGQSIVVGGEKGTTVNNITISNSGGGGSSGGSGLDFTPQISALDQRVGLLEKAEEVLRQENERQNERLEALEGLGIVDLSFEEDERNLSIELANGEVFETTITSEQFTMEVVNGELIITIGDQTHTVALPVGVQSDWTQTDPDEPDFIKNKIPIWITEGTPQDNMSPVDSITDGEMRPPTSNAVYDKIASLDVASVGGSGKYIESISEVDGKIVAVEQNIADTVTVDNMQSVSSNAVYNETQKITSWSGNGVYLYKIGKFVFGTFTTTLSGSSPAYISYPSEFTPINEVRCAFLNNSSDMPSGQFIVYTNGSIGVWLGGGGSFPNAVLKCSFMYITA